MATETVFRHWVTHKPLVVSNASTDVIVRALVVANRDGKITDAEYAMTYAEVCEIGYLPQALGGRRVDPEAMTAWQTRTWGGH